MFCGRKLAYRVASSRSKQTSTERLDVASTLAPNNSLPERTPFVRTAIDRLFLAHPRSVKEHYLTHAVAALRFTSLLFRAGLAALVHAVVPSLFERTASSIISTLHSEIDASLGPARERPRWDA